MEQGRESPPPPPPPPPPPLQHYDNCHPTTLSPWEKLGLKKRGWLSALVSSNHSSSHHSARAADMVCFVDVFKRRRRHFGLSQMEMGSLLGFVNIPGWHYRRLAQSSVCSFEKLHLTLGGMERLRRPMSALLQMLEQKEIRASLERERQNKRIRLPLNDMERQILDTHFAADPLPKPKSIETLALFLQLPSRSVRIWFCNERRKRKMLANDACNPENENEYEQINGL